MFCVRIFAGLLLAAGLAACTSTSPLDIFNTPEPKPEAQNAAQQDAGSAQTASADGASGQQPDAEANSKTGANTGTGANSETQPGAPTQLVRSPDGTGGATPTPAQDSGPQLAASQNPAAPAQTQDSPQPAQTGAQDGATTPAPGDNSLTAAARTQGSEEERTGYRVEQSGVGSGLQRRLNKMLGGSSTATPEVDQLIKDSELVGTWKLEEEDGLRTCMLNLADKEQGYQAQLSQGCSDNIAAVSNWGLFGSDLLLRNGDNEVVARLRKGETGTSWLGFTIGSGIPLFLSKG